MRELALQVLEGERARMPMVGEILKPELMPVVVEISDPELEHEAVARRISDLKSMGFHAAARKAESAHKMVMAYGEYTFVSEETVGKFNERLKKETLEEDSRARRFKTLAFIPIEKYDRVPPTHVLQAISDAKKKEIFDRFEVAKIDWREELKDPIVFGRIEGCTDRFFVAQWDDDVRIEDLLSL